MVLSKLGAASNPIEVESYYSSVTTNQKRNQKRVTVRINECG